MNTIAKGTRILIGKEAKQYSETCSVIRNHLNYLGFDEVIIPSISNTQIFTEKAGDEIVGQMYNFNDKKGRDICLIPEVTAIIQRIWDESWSRFMPKPTKVFYIQRCYRYERPQKGRYREFTQAGVEILGPVTSETKQIAIDSLKSTLDLFNIEYEFKDSVKRGLHYYEGDGFEVEMQNLGAQKQIAGGGEYKQGVGWAIGVDRLILSKIQD
jgi:histidyl-tRNA synthetase